MAVNKLGTTTPMIYCSVGENCLGQGVLNRFELTNVLSPFSWSRSNIDYVLGMVAEGFAGMLDPAHLQYQERYGVKLATNSKYSCASVFEPSVSSGFEFTHHDVIASNDAADSFLRKAERFTALLRSDDPVTFVYHHRASPRSDLEYVLQKLNDLVNLAGPNAAVTCFTQKIVNSAVDRGIDYTRQGACDLHVFRTLKTWGGPDNATFWGEVDDDLFKAMLVR